MFFFVGELELPEELPEFPYENEFIQEIENAILKYGGQEGVHLLKEHAIGKKHALTGKTRKLKKNIFVFL